ncbi:MAG: leucine-rich repeat domain-containing protein, partial [Clostridia bacterium]
PQSVKKIGKESFLGCKALKNVNLPQKLTSIDEGAFQYCEGLEKLDIPESIKKIGDGAFLGCSNLTRFDVPKSIKNIENHMFLSCSGLKFLSIPSNIENIGIRAFNGCTSLVGIKISDGVKNIGDGAFGGCTSLVGVTIPKSCASVGEYVFNGCKSLRSISLHDGVTNIGAYSFNGCKSLATVSIPPNVTNIGNSAFFGCEKLKSIKIPDKVENIGENAFAYCQNLNQIVFPKKIKSIGEMAFVGCKFNYFYRIKQSKNFIFASEMPKNMEDCEDFIDICKLSNNFTNFDCSILLKEKRREEIIGLATLLRKNKFKLPFGFAIELIENNCLEEFIKTSCFKFFKNELSGILKLISEEDEDEDLPFFKFAKVLGCFSGDKLRDRNGRETETPIAQKASLFLAQIVKEKMISIGEYENLFESLSVDIKPNQNFLKFLTDGVRGKFSNVKMLLELEKNFHGLFVKTMSNFDRAEFFRICEEGGKTKVRSWQSALEKFYRTVKYSGVNESNRDIADLFEEKGCSNSTFNLASKLRLKAKENNVGHHILNEELKEDTIMETLEKKRLSSNSLLFDSQDLIADLFSKKFTYEMLDKYDPKNAIMNLFCSCCCSIANVEYGKDIAKASIVAKDVQNIVINDSSGNLIAKGAMFVNIENGYAVINDFEINENFRKHEIKSSGRYNVLPDSEGEKERGMIFFAFQRGINAFVQKFNEKYPNNPIKKINIGMGCNRLKLQCDELEKETNNLPVPSEYSFEDAEQEQHILYDREKAFIKERGRDEGMER